MSFKKSVIPLILAAIFTGCYAPHDHQSNGQIPISVDSLFESTGNAQLDSLLRIAITSPQDTNLVRLYSKIGNMYPNSDFNKAKMYYLKGIELSERLDWNTGRYLYANDMSQILEREGFVDSALALLLPALELAKREKKEVWIGSIAANTATAYGYKDWHETALSYYMEALTVLERRDKNDTLRLGTLYYMMAQAYSRINAVDKTIEYAQKAIAIKPKNPSALVMLAKAYSNEHQNEKANDYLKEALRISEQQNNRFLTGSIYFELGSNALYLYDLGMAERYVRRSFEISKELGDIAHYYAAMLLLGKLEQLKGHFAQSETLVAEALQFAQKHDLSDFQRFCYRILSELSVAQHKYRENIQYWNEMDLAETAMARETTLHASEEMAAKYETEKKELKISALEDERRLMMWLSMAGGAALLLALAVFLFLWLLTVQKKRLAEQQRQLAEQQVKQLEQEKQLVATQSLLDGETQERSRLARDLHDGLGSILTGTRLNLQEMKKEAVLNPMMLERYNTAFGLLDESIREMRRLAHHLMPEALSAFGLKQAAADFCRTIPHATFHYFGDETRFDPRKEIVMYRIMHELVNNALKHSGATHILVQIIRDADAVSLTVQDNGCGFDPATVSNGMGLSNIRTRVAAFSGNLMMDAKPGTGTEINVVIEI